MSEETLFEKIIKRKIPSDIVYEDDETLAFRDINPQAPTHVLVVPKRVISGIAAAEDGDALLLGKLLLTAKKVAEQEGLSNGYRLVINQGHDGQQTVPHIHIHVIGGRMLNWPPG